MVLARGRDDLSVGVSAVERIQGVVLGSQLLRLVPGRVAVGDESCTSFFAGLLRGTTLGLHVDGLFRRFGGIEHLEEVRPADPFFLAVGKRFLKEVIGPRTEAASLEDMRDRYGLDSPQQLILVPGLPGRIPEDHLIKNNTQRPYIAFGCIRTAF